MLINFRILGMVLFFLTIAFLGVVAVRSSNQPVNWIECIPPHGQFSANRVENGLTLSVHDTAIELTVPNCDNDLFPEKFFLHVYPQTITGAVPADFVNMDFELRLETGTKTTGNGVTVCKYKKTFNGLSAQTVVVGQFLAPKGLPFQVLWSRTFFPGLNR